MTQPIKLNLMKTTFLFSAAVILTTGLQAQQWLGSGVNTGNIWRAGNVGIGNTSPSTVLHVSSTGATQFLVERTSGQINGLKVFFTSNPAVGIAIGAGSTIFQNQATVSDMLFMHNPTTAGMILRYTGNVGIGTTNPANAKLEVTADPSGVTTTTAGIFTSTGNSATSFGGVVGRVNSTNGLGNWLVGVQGEASSAVGFCGQQNMGFWGIGQGAATNIGGLFVAGGAAVGGCCSTNIGVWGTIGGNCSNNWAGFFNGDVGSTGAFISVSDRKLKTEIRPMENMLDKIMRLKPSTYMFKTDAEYKDMHLPKGNQLGLIAQELEEVFPELITEVAELKAKPEGSEGITSAAFKGVQYLPLIPVLISAMQEQQKLIKDQQLQLSEQKQLINQLSQKAGMSTGLNQPEAEGFYMEQNEPNPFSGSAVIRYNLPQSISNAHMAVYDLSGKQITTLQLQKGESSLTISSDQLAAGMYMYSIVADGKVLDTKRMVVSGK